MIAEYFTKPLHELLLISFSKVIFGWRHFNNLNNNILIPPRELIGKHISGDNVKTSE